MRCAWAALALVLLHIPASEATLFVASQAARSDAVLVGNVVTMESRWEGRRIVTIASVDVEQIGRGAIARRFELVLPGGVVDGIGMRVLGAPTLRAGDRAVFALRSSGVRWQLADLTAGALAIWQDAGGVDHVTDPRGHSHRLVDLLEAR